MYEIKTVRGYDFYECASVLQKAIRRGDKIYAGFFALELFASGYSNYVWKRLYTISAEDCYPAITKEIDALHNGFILVNDKKSKDGKEKGRIFISKAVLLLCECLKSRDADHIQCLSYDKGVLVDESIVNEYIVNLSEQDMLNIPQYTYDCHTLKGKKMGKTKEDFFKEEYKALDKKAPSLFDDLFNGG